MDWISWFCSWLWRNLSQGGWVDQGKSFGVVIPLMYLVSVLWGNGLVYMDTGASAHG